MSDEVKPELTKEQVAEEVQKLAEEEVKNADATVTSVANEEQKTGERVPLTEEQTRMMAANQHTAGLNLFQDLSRKLSARAMRRIIVGLMQLPHLENKMHSNFQTDQEKFLFDVGQKVLAAKYAILYDYMVQQRKQDLAAAKASASETPKEENSSPTEEKSNG